MLICIKLYIFVYNNQRTIIRTTVVYYYLLLLKFTRLKTNMNKLKVRSIMKKLIEAREIFKFQKSNIFSIHAERYNMCNSNYKNYL